MDASVDFEFVRFAELLATVFKGTGKDFGIGSFGVE